MLFSPMPRLGTFIILRSRTLSAGLLITEAYARISLISARSKKRMAPIILYGIPLLAIACSMARDMALVRYSTAKLRKLSPSSCMAATVSHMYLASSS